jgi:4-amino-4-deoxy-L-arabinose transferase-like glycosyltransferase
MTEHIQKKTLSSPQRASTKTIASFLVRYEFLIPLALFLAFLAVTLPGISWGAPSAWHPDEIVVRSINALNGQWKFSETNFDYPDLPQYAMFWLGKLVLALGYGKTQILVTARVLSAVLAGLTIVLTYLIARRAGGSVIVGGLSGLFLLCVSEMVHNGHFAHNDTYVMFFTTLSILMLLQYHKKGHRVWLYAAFLTVGMAASSKYIGGSLILAPLAYFLFSQRRNFRSQLFSILETLFIGTALTFLGYAIGTPKALFWMTYYFKRVFTALGWQINYGHTPGAVRGVIGQYQVLWNGLGIVLFLLFGAAFVWACIHVIQACRRKTLTHESRAASFSILLLALLALDLPMMVSYNYQFRYFLTILPVLTVFSGFFAEWTYTQASQSTNSIFSKTVIAAGILIVIFSFARLVSVAMLFINDSRAPAGTFIKTLPVGTSLEHTYYPPAIPGGRFEREHNYPLYFIRNINDKLPTDKKYKFNIGEAGLDDRQTTYLVTDSFSADKFNDPYTCSIMQAECDFFKQLAAGRSSHYRLIKEFSYHLPAFLPRISVEYVNPTIRIYERTP